MIFGICHKLSLKLCKRPEWLKTASCYLRVAKRRCPIVRETLGNNWWTSISLSYQSLRVSICNENKQLTIWLMRLCHSMTAKPLECRQLIAKSLHYQSDCNVEYYWMRHKLDVQNDDELLSPLSDPSMYCFSFAPLTKLVMLVSPDLTVSVTASCIYTHCIRYCHFWWSDQLHLTVKYEIILLAKWDYFWQLDHHASSSRRYYTTLYRIWRLNKVVILVIYAYIHVFINASTVLYVISYSKVRRSFRRNTHATTLCQCVGQHWIPNLFSYSLAVPFTGFRERITHWITVLSIFSSRKRNILERGTGWWCQ